MPPSSSAQTPRVADDRPALILANLGTPAAPTPRAVRSFLREFLSDRRVIEMNPLLWRPVLEGVILRVRPRASAAKYATVWRPGQQASRSGSPLMHYSERQGELLQRELGESVQVRIAMRYGQPSLRRVMSELMETGCRRIALVPLYPQYAASSAGTVVDEAARFILESRNQPELRTIRSFEAAPAYIEALPAARPARRARPPHLPVRLRSRRLDRAGHHRHGRRAGARRLPPPRHHLPRLLLRLPGDA